MLPSPHSLHLASNEPSKAALRTIASVREDIAACGVQEFNGCADLIESASTNLNPLMLVEVPCKSPTGLAQKVLFQVQRCRLNNQAPEPSLAFAEVLVVHAA